MWMSLRYFLLSVLDGGTDQWQQQCVMCEWNPYGEHGKGV